MTIVMVIILVFLLCRVLIVVRMSDLAADALLMVSMRCLVMLGFLTWCRRLRVPFRPCIMNVLSGWFPVRTTVAVIGLVLRASLFIVLQRRLVASLCTILLIIGVVLRLSAMCCRLTQQLVLPFEDRAIPLRIIVPLRTRRPKRLRLSIVLGQLCRCCV